MTHPHHQQRVRKPAALSLSSTGDDGADTHISSRGLCIDIWLSADVVHLDPREARRVAARLVAFADWLDAQKEKP